MFGRVDGATFGMSESMDRRSEAGGCGRVEFDIGPGGNGHDEYDEVRR